MHEVGEERRWLGGGRLRVSFSVLSSLPQLVDGQCQISLQKAEFQGVLEKPLLAYDSQGCAMLQQPLLSLRVSGFP